MSARMNLVPMVVLWLLAAAMVLAYYRFPCAAAALEPLARWQTECGWSASFLNRLFFAGVVPGIFLVTVKALKVRRPLRVACAQGVWCGLWGILCGWFYELQALVVGNDASVSTLFLKTAVDQFVWTVLVMAPVDAVFFFWLGRDFSLSRMRAEWPRSFVHGVVLPNLLSNWIVWIPVLCVIYAFPLPLQIQIAGIVGSFWTLLCLQIGRRSAVREKA